MDKDKIVHAIDKNDACRFSKLSFRVFLLSVVIFLLLFIVTILNTRNVPFEYFVLILILSFIFSTLAGFVLTIKSLMAKEADTFYKTIGAIGNLLFFMMMSGMVGFVLNDVFVFFM